MLLANADFLVQMAQGAGVRGESGMDAINRLHGGMLAGPTAASACRPCSSKTGLPA